MITSSKNLYSLLRQPVYICNFLLKLSMAFPKFGLFVKSNKKRFNRDIILFYIQKKKFMVSSML